MTERIRIPFTYELLNNAQGGDAKGNVDVLKEEIFGGRFLPATVIS
jgi:hypothetical protein